MVDPKSKSNRIFRTPVDGEVEIEESVDASGDDGRPALSEMDFSTHILSLSSMALMHLGEVSGLPEGERDLSAVNHIVDTLGMLRTKTAGNLSDDETKLLDALIYDLRMKFVQARG